MQKIMCLGFEEFTLCKSSLYSCAALNPGSEIWKAHSIIDAFYVDEMGWEDRSVSEDPLNRFSDFIGVRNVETGEIIAAMRIINGNETQLPVTEHVSFEYASQGKVEFSRLAIMEEYRHEKTILYLLFKTAFCMAVKLEAKMISLFAREIFIHMLNRGGFEFELIAPPVNFRPGEKFFPTELNVEKALKKIEHLILKHETQGRHCMIPSALLAG